MSRFVEIWTDGSCNNRLNGPGRKGGKGGYGVVMIFDGKFKHTFYGGSFDNTTSARMEIRGVIEAVKRITPQYKATIYCDNQYVVNTIAKGWLFDWKAQGVLSSKANADLWMQFYQLYQQFDKDQITMQWIRGHNGNQYNELADRLAAKGANSKFKIVDLCNLKDLEE